MLRLGVLDTPTRTRLSELATGADVNVVVGQALGDPERDAGWHLVLTAVAALGDADVVLNDSAALTEMWNGRLRVYAANLAAGRRAPRRQQAILADPDAMWPTTARRILARLSVAMGPLALRADHIGSTSVLGLPAKDLIDLQVVVPTLPDTAAAAAHALDAGLVAVRGGNFYAIDRHDRQHPVSILVDADPGRPVNVHIHPATSPVWREMLLFRDWLRGDPAHRQEYLRFKRDLAAWPNRDVNDYSRDKRSWVNHAVNRAEHWAHTTGWEIEPPRHHCLGG